jgi:hypothetical protein
MEESIKLCAQGMFYLAAAGAPTLTKWGLAALYDLVAMAARRPEALQLLSANVQKLNDLNTERYNAWLCLNKPSNQSLDMIPGSLELLSEMFGQLMKLRGTSDTSNEKAYHKLVNTEMREGPRRLHSILTLEVLLANEFALADTGQSNNGDGYQCVDMCDLGARVIDAGMMDGFVKWVTKKVVREGRR